ncbi:hypothetical protein D3C71_2206960 [compost metagenome]
MQQGFEHLVGDPPVRQLAIGQLTSEELRGRPRWVEGTIEIAADLGSLLTDNGPHRYFSERLGR